MTANVTYLNREKPMTVIHHALSVQQTYSHFEQLLQSRNCFQSLCCE